MKKVGIIGGMSWEGTAHYYSEINKFFQQYYGGVSSANLIIDSLNFQEVTNFQLQGNWKEIERMVVKSVTDLTHSEADTIAIACNSIHHIFDNIDTTTPTSFIHIADPTGIEIQKNKIRKVGLLGTRFTMEEAFFRKRLKNHFEIDTIIPKKEDRKYLHQVIYDEFAKGRFELDTKKRIEVIMSDMIKAGSEGIILGCTEIGFLIQEDGYEYPVFDTTKQHIKAIVKDITKG